MEISKTLIYSAAKSVDWTFVIAIGTGTVVMWFFSRVYEHKDRE